MEISIIETNQKETDSFQNEEFKYSDIEHWGHAIEWPIEPFYFKATDENNDIVGTLNGKFEAGVIYIDNLMVGKKTRRQGVGRKLMEHLENWAKEKGAHKIFFFTREKWVASKFYENLDYKKVVVMEKHYLKADFILFEKFV